MFIDFFFISCNISDFYRSHTNINGFFSLTAMFINLWPMFIMAVCLSSISYSSFPFLFPSASLIEVRDEGRGRMKAGGILPILSSRSHTSVFIRFLRSSPFPGSSWDLASSLDCDIRKSTSLSFGRSPSPISRLPVLVSFKPLGAPWQTTCPGHQHIFS
ncbi:hypothetical protein GGI42DRAFT_337716 [Trichoderma sp. SZMC 28013]